MTKCHLKELIYEELSSLTQELVSWFVLMKSYINNHQVRSQLLYVTEGGVLHQIFGSGDQHTKNNWIQSNLRFCEDEGSKCFRIIEKGVKLDRKLIIHFGETLDQLYIQVPLELNEIERNRYFWQKERVNRIVFHSIKSYFSK